MKKSQKIIIGSLALSLILAGCSNPFKKSKPIDQNKPAENVDLTSQLANQSKIKKFGSIDELKKFLSQNASNRATNGVFTDSLAGGTGSAMKSLATPLAAGALVTEGSQATDGQPAGSQDYSKTNTQVAGVDEADIVKTDGKYIYTINNNVLRIIDAYPTEDAKVIGKIQLADSPQDIYVSGNKLAVFGQTFQVGELGDKVSSKTVDTIMPIRPSSGYTYFKVYDITDKANAKLVRDLSFEGNYFDSRMVGDYVYFVTSKYSYNYAGPSPLPIILKNNQVVATDIMPPVYYFDMPYNDSYNFTTISAINIKDDGKEANSQIYLLSANQNMYVSQKNIYITYTKYLDENQIMMETTRELIVPKLSAQDQELISKIGQVDESILSKQEKLAKQYQIMANFLSTLKADEQKQFEDELKNKVKQKYQDISKELEKTVIHKIAIDQDKIEYKTAGEVTGQVLNQFSMDEQDGYFRIATTKNYSWSRFADQDKVESYNNLYVLDNDLKVVGSLEDLAKGERIYSVRFIGNRGYLVTFKQTDPLFAIDLSTPSQPKVLGELKIPGFSQYLHPYDENTLIGLGKETTEDDGRVMTGGLKLSLFDVSQVDKPVELDKLVLGNRGSDSIALNDHKAFLFSKEKNLLVIPVSLTKAAKDNEWGSFEFGGAVVLNLEGKKFDLIGKIDHSDGGTDGRPEFMNGYSFFDNTVRRSLFIDKSLYTLSDKYLKINQLNDLKEIKKLDLADQNAAPIPEPVKPVQPRIPDGNVVY